MPSPTPLTGIIEEYVKAFIASYRLLSKNGMVPSDREVESYMRNFITTLTTQHTKEKEELVREISRAIAKRTSSELIETMSNSERLINIAEIYEDIEEIAEEHNITI